jgi:hypothetical protein
MNKQQLVWLLIRLAGVYFAYLTFFSFVSLAGTVPGLFSLPKIDSGAKTANSAVQPSPAVRVQQFPVNGTFDTPEPADAGKSADESAMDKFKGENFTSFLWFFFITAIYAAAAWYLISDGRVLFEVLNREEPQGLRRKDAEVTALNLSDRQGE